MSPEIRAILDGTTPPPAAKPPPLPQKALATESAAPPKTLPANVAPAPPAKKEWKPNDMDLFLSERPAPLGPTVVYRTHPAVKLILTYLVIVVTYQLITRPAPLSPEDAEVARILAESQQQADTSATLAPLRREMEGARAAADHAAFEARGAAAELHEAARATEIEARNAEARAALRRK